MRFLRFLKEAAGEGRGQALLSLLTPRQAEGRGPLVRTLITGASLGLFAMTLATAIHGAVVLLGALGFLYFLLSQVLGIKIDLDPASLVRPPRRAASADALN